MAVATLTLTEFLLARIAEDEAYWVAAAEYAPYCQECAVLSDAEPGPTVTRMLVECEAKRRIVEHHRLWQGAGRTDVWAQAALFETEIPLYQLALTYADHPDYREGWRP